MKADGGVTVEAGEANHSDERPEDCDCWNPEPGLPCWPCFREGFADPNPRPENRIARYVGRVREQDNQKMDATPTATGDYQK